MVVEFDAWCCCCWLVDGGHSGWSMFDEDASRLFDDDATVVFFEQHFSASELIGCIHFDHVDFLLVSPFKLRVNR